MFTEGLLLSLISLMVSVDVKHHVYRGLVSRFKAEGPRLDSASALFFLQKGCGLWTQSYDFVSHN